MKLLKLASILTLLFVLSCESIESKKEIEEDAITLFSLVPPKITGIDFTNTIKNTEDYNIFKYRNFYNGGGVSIGDINNDSLPDVYMTSNFGENNCI